MSMVWWFKCILKKIDLRKVAWEMNDLLSKCSGDQVRGCNRQKHEDIAEVITQHSTRTCDSKPHPPSPSSTGSFVYLRDKWICSRSGLTMCSKQVWNTNAKFSSKAQDPSALFSSCKLKTPSALFSSKQAQDPKCIILKQASLRVQQQMGECRDSQAAAARLSRDKGIWLRDKENLFKKIQDLTKCSKLKRAALADDRGIDQAHDGTR